MADEAAQQAWAKGRSEPPLDAEEIRRHLIGLRMKGVKPPIVADITGIPVETIHQIINGKARRVSEAAALAILGVDADDLDRLPPNITIPAKPSWRRIDRLLEKGWTAGRINRHLNRAGTGVQLDRHRITVTEARIVRDLYVRQFGIRCAICGSPLAWHKLTEPCI
jgi:hypothetical protein